jgi:hypothetical protein
LIALLQYSPCKPLQRKNGKKKVIKMKKMLVVVVMLTVMVAGLAPAAVALEGEEIAVTGVVTDQPDKADGTPTYGITDEITITGSTPPVGYLLEGDYSSYEGQRVTVYGTPGHDQEMRILDVAWVEFT